MSLKLIHSCGYHLDKLEGKARDIHRKVLVNVKLRNEVIYNYMMDPVAVQHIVPSRQPMLLSPARHGRSCHVLGLTC